MNECPCGLSAAYTDCCAPLIRGTRLPDTAEDLMRSRYTAFTQKNWDYLIETSLPSQRKLNKPEDYQHKVQDIQWKSLEVFDRKMGEREDEEGEVGFIAYYVENGEEKSLHEASRFQKENGRWYYCEGDSQKHTHSGGGSCAAPPKPYIRTQAKVGRNEPCPCGSGKKFKKCCAK